MRNFFLRILLLFLRSLIYVKRGLIYSGKFAGRSLWPFVRVIGIRIFFPIYFYVMRAMKRKERIHEFYVGAISSGPRRTTILFQICVVGITIFLLTTESKLFSGEPNRGTSFLAAYAFTNPYGEAYFGEFVTEEEGGIISQDTEIEFGGIVAGGRSIFVPSTGLIPSTLVPSISRQGGKRNRVETYIVVSGDTVSSIATKFDVSQETILWENKLTIRSKLRIGDVLRILPETGVTYRVSRGDTLIGIAKKFNIDAERIKASNKINDAGELVAGETLLIPEGKPLSAPVKATPRRTSLVVDSPVAVPRANDLGTQLLWPTSGRVITQYYGSRHTGLDIDGHYNSPIYASEDGVVIKSGWNSGGYGMYIVIDHGGGLQTLYAHSSKVFVSVGESVTRGQVIAMVGTTGRSTGTHLHYEVRVNSRRMNPLKYTR